MKRTPYMILPAIVISFIMGKAGHVGPYPAEGFFILTSIVCGVAAYLDTKDEGK